MDESGTASDALRILLTNDDGFDAPGLAALYEELSAVASVTAVAPAENQSGVGRTRSHRAVREDHPWGVAVSGTPADCVAYGVGGVDREFDLVVSGCNHGPNMGAYVIGRSGTVGAAMEAAFLGTPAVAVSAYHNVEFFPHPAADYDFDASARVARELVVRVLSADVFDSADILNVNVPVDVADPRMRVTEPYHDYDVRVDHDPPEFGQDPADDDAGVVGGTHDGGDDAAEEVAIRDVVWPDAVGWENPFPAGEDLRERYPVGSDRRALVDGEVSVSPLTAPASVGHTPELDGVVAGFNDSVRQREQERAEEE